MEESSYIHKSHNVTALIYHLVTPAKYRKVIFNQELDEYLCTICNGIEDRYEIRFLEIGTDDDHVHFLHCSRATSKAHPHPTLRRSSFPNLSGKSSPKINNK